jgi:cysteine-rich repeat protein
MRPRLMAAAGILSLMLAMLIAGCGSSDDGGEFRKCGNGILDPHEECDDGNISDNDGCLGTCQFNVCGDFFINSDQNDPGFEQCEQGGILGGATCQDLGFARGTLGCTPQCTFDTSQCTGTVGSTPTSTPGDGGTPTPAGTSSGVTGTPTPATTPSGSACQPGDQIVVIESLDKPYGAARADLVYPASIAIPGTGTASSVSERVVFTPTGGLTQVNDTASSGSVDDTLTTSFVGTADVAVGTFVTVTFDCIEGQVPPTAADFMCTVVSASTGGGNPITDEQCALTVNGR